ncbi:MAG TPA: hypothetical protein VFR94_04755 [Nitrososphaeraceae archaeon]|nr:hypothetical protein [Nitrososphaeraceae archaeon]
MSRAYKAANIGSMVDVLIGVVILITFRVMGAPSSSSNFGFPCSICTKRET